MNLPFSRTSTLLQDAEVLAAAPLDFDANALEGFDVGKGAAVEDGQLQIVEFDDDVVDADADAGRKEDARWWR